MQYENLINKLLDLGIEEDINTGDITTAVSYTHLTLPTTWPV